jgi:hypothetical protein
MSGPIGTVPNQQPRTARDHNHRHGSADLRVRPLGMHPRHLGLWGAHIVYRDAPRRRISIQPEIHDRLRRAEPTWIGTTSKRFSFIAQGCRVAATLGDRFPKGAGALKGLA